MVVMMMLVMVMVVVVSMLLMCWQEFGGNVDKNLERYQYLNSPFIARYVRFHPLEWSRRITMRAGLIGCPYKGNRTQTV